MPDCESRRRKTENDRSHIHFWLPSQTRLPLLVSPHWYPFRPSFSRGSQKRYHRNRRPSLQRENRPHHVHPRQGNSQWRNLCHRRYRRQLRPHICRPQPSESRIGVVDSMRRPCRKCHAHCGHSGAKWRLRPRLPGSCGCAGENPQPHTELLLASLSAGVGKTAYGDAGCFRPTQCQILRRTKH